MIAAGVGSPTWTIDQLVGPRCAGCAGPLTGRPQQQTCSPRCRQRWRRLRELPYHEAAARAWGFEPTDYWRTPPEIVADAARRLGVPRFELDAAALPLDAVAASHIPPWKDGLRLAWGPGPTWCNPPYSRAGGGIEPWARKAIAERRAGCSCALLLPASVATSWFSDLLEAGARAVLYEGRVNFLRPDGRRSTGARHDSALFLLGPRVKPGMERADRPSPVGGRRV